MGGIFKGKKVAGVDADPEAAELRRNALETSRFQQSALRKLNNQANEDPTGLVRLGATREITGLQSGVEDFRRQQDSRLARRGLGATSLGSGALAGLQQNVSQRSSEIRAAIPERVAALRRQRTQALLGAATSVASTNRVPIRFKGTPGTKKKSLFGKLLPVAGAVVGGIYGGPAGASAGAAAGTAVSGSIE